MKLKKLTHINILAYTFTNTSARVPFSGAKRGAQRAWTQCWGQCPSMHTRKTCQQKPAERKWHGKTLQKYGFQRTIGYNVILRHVFSRKRFFSCLDFAVKYPWAFFEATTERSISRGLQDKIGLDENSKTKTMVSKTVRGCVRQGSPYVAQHRGLHHEPCAAKSGWMLFLGLRSAPKTGGKRVPVTFLQRHFYKRGIVSTTMNLQKWDPELNTTTYMLYVYLNTLVYTCVYTYAVAPELGPRFGVFWDRTWSKVAPELGPKCFWLVFPQFYSVFGMLKSQRVCRGSKIIFLAVCQGVKQGFSKKNVHFLFFSFLCWKKWTGKYEKTEKENFKKKKTEK